MTVTTVPAPRMKRSARTMIPAPPHSLVPRWVATGSGRVWMFTALLAAVGLAVLLGVTAGLATYPAPFPLPWWLLAAGFFLAEAQVVHVQFAREAHTLSLSEIPLVLGIFLAPQPDLILALLVGSGCALVFMRHQALPKLAFNLAQFLLWGSLASWITHAAVPDVRAPSIAAWLATFAATLATGTLAAAAVSTAISLSEGRPMFAAFGKSWAISSAVTVVNTSLGLLAVVVLWATPWAVLLLPLPVAIVFLAYRTHVGNTRQAESLSLLNEAHLKRAESPGAGAATSILQLARRMFRAEYAELIVTAHDPALRTTVGPTEIEELRTLTSGEDRLISASLRGRSSRLVGRGQSPAVVLASGHALRDAMVAEVLGSDGRLGVLIVGDRLGDVSQFDAADLRLFETVAHQAGSVIENGQLEASISQLTEFEQQLRRHDPLTGLANRAYFREQLESAAKTAGRTVPAVIVVDIDDFKLVNDALGHHSGDALLTQIAGRIRNVAGDTVLAARIGGDEFGILVQGGRSLTRARNVASQLAKSLETPFMIAGQEVTVAVSCGVAAASSADEVLRDADVAMLTAKARGKHQAVVFEQSMLDSLVERHALGADLQRALTEGQFELVYQPVVDLRSMEYVGAEALLRWRHPERGVIGPSAFIAIAEETGLIRDIGRSVLEMACRTARMWTGPDSVRRSVAVNLSYVQLEDPGLVSDVARALHRSGLEPWALTLEITESGLLHDSRTAIDRLQELRAMGIKISVDDFGTGYSSLSYLRRLPIDQLKIPREFVSAGGSGLHDSVLVGAMLAMGRALGLEIVIEGIEEPAQANLLRGMGGELGQGHLYAKPMSAVEIGHLFATGRAAAA